MTETPLFPELEDWHTTEIRLGRSDGYCPLIGFDHIVAMWQGAVLYLDRPGRRFDDD